ncbi:MAG: VWA domain-containing protein [Thiolinea sp.]
MYARDAAPNRLDAARFKLLDLLQQRRDGQTALVVFAGDAFTVSPLTDDTEAIAAQAKNLSPEVMPVQGSRAELAIGRAVKPAAGGC